MPKKGGRITGHSVYRPSKDERDPRLTLMRKAASSREPYTVRGGPRRVQQYGAPAAITLAPIKALKDDGV